jgi:glycerol-3-phosphate acyltransferase PlsY
VSLNIVLLILGGYLVGAIPFGLITARLKGVDIRKVGSGNVGATNVGRVLGSKWGLLVLLLDATKGASVSLSAAFVADHVEKMSGAGRDMVLLGAALAAVVGNIAPVYLKFKGGKGVATALGAVMAIYPYLTLPGSAALVVFVLVVRSSGYISLGSICAAITLPIAFVVASRMKEWPLDEHYPLLILTVLLSLIVLWRHRSNMSRLIAGTENKHQLGRPRA